MQLKLGFSLVLLISLAVTAPIEFSNTDVERRNAGPGGPPGPPDGGPGHHDDWNKGWQDNRDGNKGSQNNNWNQGSQNNKDGDKGSQNSNQNYNAGSPSNPGYDPNEKLGPGWPANGGDAGDTDANGNCVAGLDGVATEGNLFWADNCEG